MYLAFERRQQISHRCNVNKSAIRFPSHIPACDMENVAQSTL